MIDIIRQRLATYSARNALEEEQATKEILQEVALYLGRRRASEKNFCHRLESGVSRCGAFRAPPRPGKFEALEREILQQPSSPTYQRRMMGLETKAPRQPAAPSRAKHHDH